MDGKTRKGSIGEDILEDQKTDAKPLQLPKILDIPLDVMVDVISRLPLKLIIKCKSLSKDFKNIISGHSFSRLYQTNNSNSFRYVFFNLSNYQPPSLGLAEFDQRDIHNEKGNHEIIEVANFNLSTITEGSPFSIRGYCNGLFCLSIIEGDIEHLLVTNPILGEVIYLPKTADSDTKDIFVLTHQKKKDIFVFDYGIGYCQFTNRYKVLMIITEYSRREKYYEDNTQIFTIGSDKNWRSVLDVKGSYDIQWDYFRNPREKSTPMLAFSSALHWAVHPVKLSRSTNIVPRFGLENYICAFDMTEEKVTTLPFPPKDHDIDCYFGDLSVLSEKLCISQVRVYDGDHVYVWVMDDYGVEAYWTKLFSLERSTLPIYSKYFTFVSLTVSAGVLVISDHYELMFYDLEKKKCFKAVRLYYQNCYFFHFVPCFVPCVEQI